MLMIDKGKQLKIPMGVQTTSDPVYAVNQAGDFSKQSVKEKPWPQDAQEKQPMQEHNEGRSLGAIIVKDAIARMVQLGDVPRGLAMTSFKSGNGEGTTRAVSSRCRTATCRRHMPKGWRQ